MRPVVRFGVPVVLVALAAVGVWLVVSGSGDPDEAGPGQLAIDGTDVASIEELAGIEVPEGAADFLTARIDDDSQLDVTFTISPDDESAFVVDSGLPDPVAEQRVITHASPLWELNVDETIRGAADSTGSVNRAVELVEEDGRTRVRLVLTAP